MDFPPPPHYYLAYGSGPDARPPPPPVEGEYMCFGQKYTTVSGLPTLKDVGIEQVYPDVHAGRASIAELHRLSHSLLFLYLDFLDAVTNDPEQMPAVRDDIRLVALNLHHLINSYRPHQARETLLEHLKEQRRQLQHLLTGLKGAMDGCKEAVEAIKAQGREDGPPNDDAPAAKRARVDAPNEPNGDARPAAE